MSIENSSPFFLCKVLHSLVSVTLNNVILPLRKELKRCSESTEILSLEIQDAENKTYEYLAQLISVVCNAAEDVANEILKEYPKSETCFSCLGISENTGQDLLRIREIGFLQLLDMPDEEVNNILLSYGDSTEEIEHVLSGLAKIRGNIDLIESSIAFDDDTRNLIKLVIRLTKENETDDFNTPRGCTSITSSWVPTSTTTFLKEQSYTECFGKTLRASNDGIFYRLPASTCDLSSNTQSTTPCVSAKASASSLRAVSCMRETPVFTPQYYSSTKCASGSHSFGHTSLITHFPWDFDSRYSSGGLSVPCTPMWNGKSASVSPGIPVRNERRCATPENLMSPVHPSATYHVYGREYHSKQPGTPPPKHRLKLPFPLHRSSSHESNLTNRLSSPFNSALVNLSPRDSLKTRGSVAGPLSCDYCLPLAANGAIQDSGGFSLNGHCKSPNAVQSNVLLKTQLGDSCGMELVSDGSMNRRGHSPSGGRYYGSVGRIPTDGRLSKGSIYPTNSSTNIDYDVALGGFTVTGSTSGATFVFTRYGTMHRFETESKIGNFVRGTPCAVCSNRMNFRLQHCLYCKIKVHRSCLPNTRDLRCIPPGQCGDGSDPRGSPTATHKMHINVLPGSQTALRPTSSTPAFQGSESTSISSCTSSTPGSPFGVGASLLSTHQVSQVAVDGSTSIQSLHSPSYSTMITSNLTAGGSRLTSPASVHTCAVSASGHHAGHVCNRFDFSATNQAGKDSTQAPCIGPQDSSGVHHPTGVQCSADSEQTVVDTLIRRFDSMDSQDDDGNLARANSISVTLKDWDIPMEHLIIKDVIGHGTFGTVHRAKWHGEVAVKFIGIDPEDEDGSARLEAFKREVALLHKTRHENLVLFMGACMKPPDLAIVTQLSQGETLYHQLHYRGTVIPINRTINIAIQIAKGMGYLHARGIVHRDLKTRNIFVEPNSRVVIGDFGVFNCVQLYKKAKWGNYLNVPPFWLCYVAPEVIQSLKSVCSSVTSASELPFSSSSDVFAFGTVWYELLTSEFPFKNGPAETVIYLCGRGIKPNVRILVPKDFKEILVQCWAYNPHRRPEFTALVEKLDRLPKLHRSPSYPVKPTPGFTSGSHDPLFV